MKKAFLVFTAIGIYSSVPAQQVDLFDAQEHLQKKAKQHKKINGNPVIHFTNPLFITGNRFPVEMKSYLLPNNDRVFILPVDNMPCVSPDMTRFRSMPNADDNIRQFILRQRRSGQIPTRSSLTLAPIDLAPVHGNKSSR